MKLSKKELWEVWYGFNILPRKLPRTLAWKLTQNKLALAKIIEELAKSRAEFFFETFSKPALENPQTMVEIEYAKKVKDLGLVDRGEDFLYWDEAWAEFLKADFTMTLSLKQEYEKYKEFLEAIEDTDEYRKFEKELSEEKQDYEHLGLAILQLDEFPDEVDFMTIQLLNPIIFETLAKSNPKKTK